MSLRRFRTTHFRMTVPKKLHDTRYKHQKMVKSMHKAEKSVHPVLATLQD
ncbi:MAG TPA: DUF2959 family protein [Porticoccus sp.]|nr:DUF2959 family protein [Porticoccus sp.]